MFVADSDFCLYFHGSNELLKSGIQSLSLQLTFTKYSIVSLPSFSVPERVLAPNVLAHLENPVLLVLIVIFCGRVRSTPVASDESTH